MAYRMFQSVRQLIGLPVRIVDGEVGHVDDVYLDDKTWEVRYLVVDTGEWLAGRQVLLAPAAVEDVPMPGGVLRVHVTRERIEGSPEVDLHAPALEWDLAALHAYYGWPWGDGETFTSGTEGPGPGDGRDRVLRRARAMLRFSVEARDGDAGRLDDFLFGAEDWAIAYMVIDTGTWLPRRKVILPPTWVNEVRPSVSTVYLDLKRETVEDSPEYDPDEFLEQVD